MTVAMLKNQPVSAGILLLAGAVLLSAAGCSVQDHKNGQVENVRLRTPIGSVDVRTNAVHGPDVGLPVYPGAVEAVKRGNDSGSADVHLSFGSWHLTVKAVEYRSVDPEDKVIAFYKNAMGKYGDVLTCKDKTALGEPQKTRQGLTCANDHEYDVDMDASKSHAKASDIKIAGEVKLLAGSPENQHIVAVTPQPEGTKFSIVVVQLPHKGETD
ncbi:MAG: hypothetical protein ABI164_03125 [Acidobacteriaceae bacterium]